MGMDPSTPDNLAPMALPRQNAGMGPGRLEGQTGTGWATDPARGLLRDDLRQRSSELADIYWGAIVVLDSHDNPERPYRGQPGLGAAALDGLFDAGVAESASLAEPQPRLASVWPPGSCSQIAVQALAGLVAEVTGPWSTALAQDDRDVLVEVDVLDPEPGQLATTHPGVEEEPNDRVIAALLEAGPGARVQDLPQILLTEDRWGRLGDMRRVHRGHRVALDLALFRQPLEELLERTEPLRNRGRLPRGVLEPEQEGLNVLAPEIGNSTRSAIPFQECVELGDRLRIRHDRGWRLVLGPHMTGERSEVGGNVRPGCRITSSATSG